jgi:hypothetical protein
MLIYDFDILQNLSTTIMASGICLLNAMSSTVENCRFSIWSILRAASGRAHGSETSSMRLKPACGLYLDSITTLMLFKPAFPASVVKDNQARRDKKSRILLARAKFIYLLGRKGTDRSEA